MFINIPEDIVRRLEKLAQQEDATVGDVLENLLNRYMPEPQSGSLADMARNAREASLSSPQPVDTAERSRSILNTEFADYLKGRMDRDDHNG
ncbi:MAG: hypothetical protein K8I82_06720 [Anaerolineae bacterium]|nr:hypothetical protein [Anaerolineae bacterium]